MRFLGGTGSYWLGQQSFIKFIVLCRAVIAYKSREVLKRDGVTLLCWWGNIYTFCISDEVTSYLQSMYPTISVITRAWVFGNLMAYHIVGVWISTFLNFKSFYWSVPNARIAGKLEMFPEFDMNVKLIFHFKQQIVIWRIHGIIAEVFAHLLDCLDAWKTFPFSHTGQCLLATDSLRRAICISA